MRQLPLLLLSVMTLFNMAWGQVPEPPQPVLTWQSEAGQRVEAAFVRLEEGTAVLRSRDGREIRVELKDLEEGSRAQALDLGRRSTARAARAAHDEGAYRLRVYPRAVPFTLDAIEEGKPIGYGPLMAEVVLVEQTPEGEKIHRSLGMSGPVRDEGDESVWRGRMQNRMLVEIRLKRNDNNVALAWHVNPNQVESGKMEARVSLVFPSLESSPEDAKDLKIETTSAEGVKTVDTTTASDALAANYSRLTLALPSSKTLLTLHAPPGGRGSLGIFVEPTQTLAAGFRIDTRLAQPTRDDPAWFRLEFTPKP